MNEKSFDICIPIVVVLIAVAVWQFDGLVTDDPDTRHSSVELAASPSPQGARRATEVPG